MCAKGDTFCLRAAAMMQICYEKKAVEEGMCICAYACGCVCALVYEVNKTKYPEVLSGKEAVHACAYANIFLVFVRILFMGIIVSTSKSGPQSP
jgi:hypothetical protein